MVRFIKSTLTCLIIFSLVYCQNKNNCGVGCKICDIDQQNQGSYKCSICNQGYNIDTSSNKCVYSNCQDNLFLQIDESLGDDSKGSCVSICNPLYIGDPIQKICVLLSQCSSEFQTEQNFLSSSLPEEIFIYQEIYYAVVQNGYLSLFDRSQIQLIRHINFQSNDLRVQNINGLVAVLTNKNQVALWDIISGQRQYIYNSTDLSINQQTQLRILNNQYIMLQYVNGNSLQLIVIYDFVNSKSIVSNSISIDQSDSLIKINNNLTFKQLENSMIVQQIVFSNSNNLQIMLSDKVICDTSDVGETIQIINTQSLDEYFSIHKNGIFEINLSLNSCLIKLKEQDIKKGKLINLGEISTSIHLIILTQQLLFDFNLNTTSKQTITDNNNNSILDFEVGNFLNANNSIIIMNNLNQLQIYNLLSSNLTFNLEQYTNFPLIATQQLLKMQTQYQNQQIQIQESQQQYEIALMNSQIQIIRKNIISNSQLETKIIDNYQMPYPTPSSQVNSLVLIYQPPLLLSCHQNGDILFYDTSSGFDFKLINKIQNQQAQCLQVGRFNNNYVVAQMNNSILLIDPYLQQVVNSNNNLKNINSFSLNFDKLAISYSYCITILSPDFSQLFNQCDNNFFFNVQSVFLNNDLQLYVQTTQEISIYQINIDQSQQQQQAEYLNKITFQNSITYFNCIVLFNSDQDKLNNNYSIDEVVIYDSQFSFSIFDSSLQLIHQVSDIELSSVNQAKRVVNDNNAYFLVGYSKSANPVVRIHGITKTSPVSFANDYTFQYSPFIDDPIKNVNQAGKVYYHVKHIMQLNFFTLHEEYQMDFDRNITYTCGHDYIFGATQTTQTKLQIGASNNYLDYAGTQQGLSGALKYQLKRYDILSTSNVLSGIHSNDQIQQVLQSTNLYMYFVRTSYQISSFNLFNNQFVELLSPQLSSDPPFSQISEIPILNSIICWNSNQILLSTYEDINQKYYFKGISQINGWIFDDVNNHFFIYGSSLVKLDTNLKFLLNISSESQNLNFIVCQSTQNTIICSNSPSQYSIIDKKKNTIQTVQVNGFQNQFKIGIDEAQQNIYLYDTQVYVYNLLGVFSQTISLNANTLNTFEVQTNYVIFSSYQYMVFIDRKTFQLQSQIQAPSGLSILKYIYMENLSQIMFYCNNSLFAQVYIYSIPAGDLVGKITGPFSWNKVGVVIDMDYDSDQSLVLYLDDTGNFYIYLLYNEYALLNNYKLTEVYDRNESLLGFTFNSDYNNIFIYSKTAIYQINYSKTGVKYEFGLKEPSKLFIPIPISQYETQFIVVNNDNNIFKYKNLTLQYEITLNQQPIDVVYDPSLDVLVYAFSNHLSFTQKYQFSSNNNLIPNTQMLNQIQFYLFLMSNVYLTYDKRIIHCNIQQASIINIIQLDTHIFVTSFESNKYKDILLVGFSNGQLLQYNLNNQNSKYYTVSDTQAINISVIKILIDDDNQSQQQAIVVTNGGQAILIDINNNQLIKKIDLISLVNEDNQVNLQDFIYDKIYSRYIFYFSGQKKIYTWNFMSNLQENFLMLPNDQGNYIKQTNLWILTSCFYQINVYSRAKNIQLYTIIKRNNFYDSILNYQVINDNQIIILLQNRFELFLIQEKKNLLISQQQSVYPRFLGYIYNQVTKFLKIYILDQTKLYETNISLGIYDDNSVTECASIVNSQNFLTAIQQIQSIIPKQSEAFSFNGRILTNQPNWNNLIYLQISGDQYDMINTFMQQQSLQNTQIITSPQNQTSNSLNLAQDTFQNIQQQTFYLSNYSLVFQNSNQTNQFSLNQNIQNIIWQNISIQQQQINATEIVIQNVKQVILNQINLQSLQNSNFQNNMQSSLIKFIKIQNVLINELIIQDSFYSQISQKQLFEFYDVQNITINLVKIMSNQNINQIFSFSLVSNLTLKNIQVIGNTISSKNRLLQSSIQNDQNLAYFQLYGCYQSFLQNFVIQNNNQVPILQTYSNYTQNNELITLMNDILQLDSIISNNNSLNTQPIYQIRSSLVEINNLKHSQNQGGLMISLSNKVMISNSQFIQNQAQNGGAIYFQGILTQILINSSQFLNNQAKSSGGAIYMEDIGSCQVIFDADSQVQNNTALIGGGVRIVKKSADTLIIPQRYPFQHNVFNNKAEIYGDDSTTYLQNLIFQNYKIPDQQTSYNFNFSNNQSDLPLKYQSQYQKSIQINNFQSGGYLVLRIYIVDNYNRYLSFSKENLTNGLYPQEIELELKAIEILIDNSNIQQSQLIGEKILNYNQYDANSRSYQLTGLQIYGTLETQQIFSISSSVLSQSQNQKPILMLIQFRECLLGEIIQQSTAEISICKQCEVGSYQLIDPQTLQQQSLIKQENMVKNQCNSCPFSANSCQGSTIILKDGYWRSGNNSDEILQCNTNTNSCQAENPQSLEGCVQGYIGPLCEQCDITGQIWDNGRYTQQVQLGFCNLCSEQALQYFFIILKAIFLIAYFVITLRVFINQFTYSQTCFYLRAMKIFPISKNSVKDYSGFFIKIIVNYLQLSSLLIEQPQIIPVSFDFLGNFIGKSNKQLSIGIDCLISIDAFNNLGKVTVYALIQSLIPVVFIVIMSFLLFVISQIRQKYIKKYHYWTLFQILYIFFQLEQISYFSNSLTCRQIGSQKYNPNDLTQLCEKQSIQAFILPYSLIILFGWSIMPLAFLYQLFKKRNKLDQCKTKYSLGYFYGELKSKYYFWEFVRMYLKVALVYLHIFMSGSFFNFSQVLVIVIIGTYIKAVFYFQPFVSKQITKSETIAYTFIILKMLLKILTQDLNSTQFTIELFILAIDYIFFISLISIILIYKASNQQSIIGRILKKVIFKILPITIALKIINFRKVSLKAYLRWKFIRSNLYHIIQKKANQNIDNIKDKCVDANKLSQNQLSRLLFQNSNINTNTYSQSSSPKQLIENPKKKHSFQLYNYNQYPKEQTIFDYVNEGESQGDDQTEQLDPKKVEQYSFQTRPSVQQSLTKSFKLFDMNEKFTYQ
ncbi:transmembrane protein, putative (macronuclear) [Tetrahymena thermophila SB210]|uniref:Transmembrane protein, putative n=1 Tax=Tetrahymena thermophila (strain SB210) TaxID=312017 RepID=I7M606_TETTS|nr:transmembrane protein, putative [Tetrahymena thermophila SB210]EAR83976.2 transmembrane protein, putative [Tetrahymena thermophila SB210]|eukprot:XP_001031639.2 transmembrane protein, putative [Tetrahymena thermophila SB210]